MVQTEKKRVVAGVDVSKDELVVRVSCDKETRRFSNDRKGIQQLVRLSQKLGVTLVVCEHTGGYERAFVKGLWNAEIPVSCAHPKAVHSLAKALKVNAKSDPQDASTLVEYGLLMEPSPTPPPAPELELLQELTGRRQDLSQSLVQEQNRAQGPNVSPMLKRSIESHIRQLKAHLKVLEKQVRELVEKHPSLQKPICRLDDEYGVGLVTAAAIYGNMPELGTLNRQKAAALAGLAPFLRESGKFSGQRRISGGRTQVRTSLYMVALTVIRKSEHPLRNFYLRLKTLGKRSSVALVAVMRKLIIRFNTILQKLRAQEASAVLA